MVSRSLDHPLDLRSYGGYLFDVDGTLMYHDRAVPGVGDALRSLKAAGKGVLAVTNNSSLDRHALAERFRRFGLPLDDSEVFSALVASAQFIAHERPGARVHVFGNPGLRTEVARHGLEVTDTEDAEYVLVGNFRGVNYDNLTVAMRALMSGARFVAVNVDRAYIGPDGRPVPGAGVMASALERGSGRPPDVVVGKPSATLLLEAAAALGRVPTECLYVGDNPEADVNGAHAAGMSALLVLTGVATRADAGPQRPEHVLPSVADLAPIFAV
ncbi:MAG: HAD-IIA family hydrolase [Chloroflexota bacterium]